MNLINKNIHRRNPRTKKYGTHLKKFDIRKYANWLDLKSELKSGLKYQPPQTERHSFQSQFSNGSVLEWSVSVHVQSCYKTNY